MSAKSSSMNDVFRFVRIRPIKIESCSVRLLDSQYSKTLAFLNNREERRRFANDALQSDRTLVFSPASLHYGEEIDNAVRSALNLPNATLRDVFASLEITDDIATRQNFVEDLERLSDTLLFSRYASNNIPPQIPVLRRLYLVYHFIAQVNADPNVLSMPLARILNHYLVPFFDSVDEHARSRIASVGIADLLVVKQHIIRYEATEIAHVENIMSGETRSREHRTFERIDDTLTIEREKIKEQEKEFQTEERFELKKEASKTIREDQKFAFDLSVSAQYGPVKLESSFGFDLETSTESSAKSASTYAKDILERSLERVTDRVREERVRTIRRETEEKNLHQFTNSPDQPHKAGVYQFLDKIYEAQVFNYGKRQIFDLIIPEPASYLWYLKGVDENNSQAVIPVPPEPLKISASQLLYDDTEASNPNHYLMLAKKYGATGITPPPQRFKNSTATFEYPPTGQSHGPEAGRLFTAPIKFDLPIEAGYKLVEGNVNCIAVTDDPERDQSITLAVGGELGIFWKGEQKFSDDAYVIFQGSEYFSFPDQPVYSTNKLTLNALPYETGNFTISAEVRCERSDNLINAWKITTYELIRQAYDSRFFEYKDELSKVEMENKQNQQIQNTDRGLPPLKSKQLIFTELKKYCIAMFMENWFDGTDVAMTGEPTRYQFDEAIKKGNLIRFLEQAIEWSQLQYAFYPYYWARKSTWDERILRSDADYEFQQFMQAGAARVVLPVRPGFEEAFSYFLEKKEPWNGSGTSPSIDDPLYLSIVDELKELSGGALGTPEPVGEPWEIKLPTKLVMLRHSSTLPAWAKREGTSWNWQPIPDDTE